MSRQYEVYWNIIKEKGQLKIELNETGLEDATNFIRKFKKAITKEKWMDEKFKRNHPMARLSVTHDQKLNTVKFELTGHYTMNDLIGGLDD